MVGRVRRAWFTVHSWIGLTCGLLLFVICWSGTIAVFSHEIDWLLNDDIRVSSDAPEMRWQEIEDTVGERFPGWRVLTISTPLNHGFAAEVLAEPKEGKMFRIYVDPATAEVRGYTSYFNVQRFFRSFHMSLFDTGELKLLGVPLGYLVVALLSFPLLASATASLVFYKRWWRGFWQLRLGHGAKAFWSSAHKMAGVWSLWFIVAIGGTGVWYLAEWYVPYEESAAEEAATGGRPLSLDQLVARARTAYPELEVTGIARWDDGPTLWVEGRDGSFLVRDRAARVTVNRFSGEVLEVRRPAQFSALDRWTETADPIHFGTWAGLWSKALYFLFGLALSGLTLTGAYLQVKRQQRQGAGRRRLPVVLAYATTMLFLLFALVSGIREIRGYGLAGWPDVSWQVIAFITAWCASVATALGAWMWKLR